MSARMQVPLNQRRHTNIAVVRLTRNGMKLEIACYKNKVASYRSGEETRLDEVLQVDRVFTSVSRGFYASLEEISQCIGHPITIGGSGGSGGSGGGGGAADDGGRRGKKRKDGRRNKEKGRRGAGSDSDESEDEKDGNVSIDTDLNNNNNNNKKQKGNRKGKRGGQRGKHSDADEDDGTSPSKNTHNTAARGGGGGVKAISEDGSSGVRGAVKGAGSDSSALDKLRSEADVVAYILKHGELQVAQQERNVEESEMIKEIIFSISEKCVNKHTNRPFPPAMIEQAVKTLGLGVRVDQSVKKHVLQYINALCENQVLPIARVPMKVRCTIRAPTSEAVNEVVAFITEWCQSNGSTLLEKTISDGTTPSAGQPPSTSQAAAVSDDDDENENENEEEEENDNNNNNDSEPDSDSENVQARKGANSSAATTSVAGGGIDCSFLLLIQPPLYRTLDSLVKKKYHGKGSLHVVESAVMTAGAANAATMFSPGMIAAANSDLREYTNASSSSSPNQLPPPHDPAATSQLATAKHVGDGDKSASPKTTKGAGKRKGKGKRNGEEEGEEGEDGENMGSDEEVDAGEAEEAPIPLDALRTVDGVAGEGPVATQSSLQDELRRELAALDGENGSDDETGGRKGGKKAKKGKRGGGNKGGDAGGKKKGAQKKEEPSEPDSDEELMVNRKQRKHAAAAAAVTTNNDWDDEEDFDYGDDEEDDGQQNA